MPGMTSLKSIAPRGYIPAVEWAKLNKIPHTRINWLLQVKKIAPYTRVGKYLFVPAEAKPDFLSTLNKDYNYKAPEGSYRVAPEPPKPYAVPAQPEVISTGSARSKPAMSDDLSAYRAMQLEVNGQKALRAKLIEDLKELLEPNMYVKDSLARLRSQKTKLEHELDEYWSGRKSNM